MATINKFSPLQTSILAFFLSAILIVFTLFTSCSNDNEDFSDTGTNLSISDIAGSWTATSATFSAPEFTDLLAEGATLSLVIEPNGRFSFTMKFAGEAADVTTGKLGFDGEWLSLKFDDDPGEVISFFVSLTNNILTLRGQTELDSDRNGVEDFGILELIMKRN